MNEEEKIIDQESMTQIPVQPETPKKKGKVAIVAGAIAAVAVAAAATVVIMASASPLALVGQGIKNSVAAFGKNEALALVKNVVSGGSIEALCDLETLVGYRMDGAVSAKLYMDKNAKAALLADVKMGQKSVLDMQVYADQENVALSSNLLGEKVYGTSLKDLSENFEQSPFGPDGEFSLGIELPEEVETAVTDSATFTKDTEVIGEAMFRKMMDIVETHTKIEKDSETIPLGGKDVKVSAVSLELDGEALGNMLVDLAKYFRDDAKLKEYLYDYAEYYGPLMDEAGLVYGDITRPQSIIDDFYDELEDLDEDDFEDAVENAKDEDIDLILTLYITKSGKELVGVKLDGEADGDEITLAAYAGPSWANLEEISLRVEDDYSAIRMAFEVKTNDKKEYAAELKVREDNETIFSGEFTWDKEDGDFELEFEDDWGDTYGAEGSMVVTSKNTTIVLESVHEDGDETELDITVVLTGSDKIPAMPKYTEILKLSEKELEDVVYDVQDVIEELEYLF